MHIYIERERERERETETYMARGGVLQTARGVHHRHGAVGEGDLTLMARGALQHVHKACVLLLFVHMV